MDELSYLERCDVRWNQPGGSARRSMPLGNGDLGANVWVEKPSSVVILLSKTDSWGEIGPLLKLGRVRIRFAQDLFFGAGAFVQRTDLRCGALHIKVTGQRNSVRLRLWADAHRPVLWVELDAEQDVEFRVELELWRTGSPEPVTHQKLWDLEMYSFPLYQESQRFWAAPDQVVEDEPERLTWYHRNEQSIFELTLQHQKLPELIGQMADPLKGRTFGACVCGPGLTRVSSHALRSVRPMRRTWLAIQALTAITPNAAGWRKQLKNGVDDTLSTDRDTVWSAHRQWWEQFWQKSWIIIRGDETAERVTQCYALQRYLLACGGRGASAIKFNGSIFSVDGVNRFGKIEDPDYRCWGAMYWLQNTRFLYWPMLAAGDFEMMRPLFQMTMETLPLLRHRVRAYFNHGGAILPECTYFWGLYPNASYGRDYPGKPRGEVENGYFRHHFQGSLEMALLMLEYYRGNGDGEFLSQTLLPFANDVLRFYNEHFSRDDEGRLLLAHINALETFHNVTNPAQDIAGLTRLLDGLLAIEDARTQAHRPFWQNLRASVPPLPIGGSGDQRVILPAQVMHDPTPYNIEVPELWTIFPFRAFGVALPELELARNTFRRRRIRKHECWHHDDLLAAFLGLADEAARMLSERFDPSTHTDAGEFPVFWKAHNDWCPDMDHGGVGMLALQSMLLQHLGDRLLLFPAWPSRWDVDFRLHGPGPVVVEGSFRDGEIESWDCQPPHRRSDVERLHRQE